jgi:hypothetical protein
VFIRILGFGLGFEPRAGVLAGVALVLVDGVQMLAGSASPLAAVLVVPDPDASLAGHHLLLLFRLGLRLCLGLLLVLLPCHLRHAGVASHYPRHIYN